MADLFDSCLSAHWEAYQPSRFQLREAWLVIKPKQAISQIQNGPLTEDKTVVPFGSGQSYTDFG
jgi:hypothetical protein